jgi:hypothetical protein
MQGRYLFQVPANLPSPIQHSMPRLRSTKRTTRPNLMAKTEIVMIIRYDSDCDVSLSESFLTILKVLIRDKAQNLYNTLRYIQQKGSYGDIYGICCTITATGLQCYGKYVVSCGCLNKLGFKYRTIYYGWVTTWYYKSGGSLWS